MSYKLALDYLILSFIWNWWENQLWSQSHQLNTAPCTRHRTVIVFKVCEQIAIEFSLFGSFFPILHCDTLENLRYWNLFWAHRLNSLSITSHRHTNIGIILLLDSISIIVSSVTCQLNTELSIDDGLSDPINDKPSLSSNSIVSSKLYTSCQPFTFESKWNNAWKIVSQQKKWALSKPSFEWKMQKKKCMRTLTMQYVTKS